MKLIWLLLIPMMWIGECEAQTYYDVLKITPNATQTEIKKAYHQLARDFHPDKHPDDPQATQNFQNISTAYQTLSDPQTRATYDTTLKSGGASALPTMTPEQVKKATKEIARMQAEFAAQKQNEQYKFNLQGLEVIFKKQLEILAKQFDATYKFLKLKFDGDMQFFEEKKRGKEEIKKSFGTLNIDNIDQEIKEIIKNIKQIEEKYNSDVQQLREKEKIEIKNIENKYKSDVAQLNQKYGIDLPQAGANDTPESSAKPQSSTEPKTDIDKLGDDIIDKIITFSKNLGKRVNSKSCNEYFKILVPDVSIKQLTPPISHFITKLFEKNGCANKTDFQNWINQSFGGATQEYLTAINNIFHEKASDKNSLQNALEKLQTKLRELKEKLKALSKNLDTLKSKLGT